MINKKSVIILAFVVLACILGTYFHFYENNLEYEATARVTWVADGDTIGVNILNLNGSFDGVSIGEDVIRFAGIDTEELHQEDAKEEHPEVRNLSQEEYEKTKYFKLAQESREFLMSLISRDNKVYLDFDDQACGKGPRGYYGRLIAVVYIKRGGELINLNAKILNWVYDRNKAKLNNLITSYPSEFEPREWLDEDYS